MDGAVCGEMAWRSGSAALLARVVAVTALVLASAAPARALPPVALEHVATLDNPVYVTHAGDSRLFVIELSGRVRIIDPILGLLPTPFLDLSGQVVLDDDGGLFTIAFHPDYANNGRFYVSYTEDGAPSAPVRSVIERYQVSGNPNVADAGSAARLIALDQPDVGHTNAQLAFGPDGYLYVGFGDGGGQGGPGCRAQHVEDSLGVDAFPGAILRLDVDQSPGAPPYYGIPGSNPFAGPDGVKDEIWAHGLRNPWRFSFDRGLGDLWIGDVGQNAREEVNRQPAASSGGQNYGWKVMEGNSCHDPDPVDLACPAGTASCFDVGYTTPLYEYVNNGWASDACSVIGGYVYRGTAIPGLSGAYVFGDFCGGFVWALAETIPGTWVRSELARLSMGLTSFGEDQAGALYVTHGDDVYRLVFDGPVIPSLGRWGLASLGALLVGVAWCGMGRGGPPGTRSL